MHPILRRTSLSLCAIASLLLAAPLAAEPGVKGDKPDRIAQGQRVDIEDYVVEGKTTIIDFTSDYCPPCRRVSPLLDALHAKRDDVAVVKVDINRPDVRGIDWRSPVAQQYRLQSVPHFKVYGPDGKLVAEGDEAAEMVFRMIEQNS